MNVDLPKSTVGSALAAKQAHWDKIREKVRKKETVEMAARPSIRSMTDYSLGKFENLERARLRWVAPNWFEFIPRSSKAFMFVRSQGERITPKNFFTDGGSIPRLFRWNDDLDPFGSLPAYLLHDWEFDLHHCGQSSKTFEDVASILMEALRTLMEGGYVRKDMSVFWLIETGINSWIAREAWNDVPPTCPVPPYEPE